jgi:DNA-binding response OmpR family regulator
MGEKCALLVESNFHLRQVIAASLENKNWRVLEASSGEFAEELLAREKPDVLIVEYLAKSEADSAIIDAFRCENNRNGHIVLTVLDRPAKQWIKKHQPDAIIYKPFDVRYLERRMDEMVQEKGGDGG